MNANSISNAKLPRKQLSDQIDRLDRILDVLSEGLNGAVADAAREGTRQAVRDAIVEIMTDPTLRARLHGATLPEPAPAPVQKPGFWARLKAKAGETAASIADAASRLIEGSIDSGRKVAKVATGGLQAVQSLGSLKTLLMLGIGVGVAVGVASFLAPHSVAAAVSGISGAVAATAIQVGIWARRAFRAMTLL